MFFVWLVARQKYRIILNEKELRECLKDIYRRVNGEVFVHAGEANVKTYSQLKPVIEEFLKNSQNRVIFVLGPVISVDKEVYKKLQNSRIDDLLLEKIHPVFELLLKHPDKVYVYYKKDDAFSDINHFAIGGRYLYIEAFHKPLEERRAVLVENPTFALKSDYVRFKNMLLNNNEHVIRLMPDRKFLRKQIMDGLIKFSDFQAA